MGIINQLDFQTANLIAAGEVVERPASACKELLENALDSGGNEITIEIKNGGTSFIRVSDNGCGMAPEDVPIAIKRHATSKIRSASDLGTISTLGFRGEALAAISAVSHIRIITKTPKAEIGTILDSIPDHEPMISTMGASVGTTVIVEDLFMNVPARRKFLKKDQTEAMAVTAIVEKIALSHPDVRIKLLVDNISKIFTQGDGNLRNAIYSMFGKDFAKNLIEIPKKNYSKLQIGVPQDNANANGVVISGFIVSPKIVRANRNYQNVFINGRYVKSRCVQAALEQAYSSYIPSDKFPACFLYITLPFSDVDVNVHPSKLEVKFTNEKTVFESVFYAVRGALEKSIPRPDLSDGAKQSGNFAEPDAVKGARLSPELRKIVNSFVPLRDSPRPASNDPYVNHKNISAEQLTLTDSLAEDASVQRETSSGSSAAYPSDDTSTKKETTESSPELPVSDPKQSSSPVEPLENTDRQPDAAQSSEVSDDQSKKEDILATLLKGVRAADGSPMRFMTPDEILNDEYLNPRPVNPRQVNMNIPDIEVDEPDTTDTNWRQSWRQAGHSEQEASFSDAHANQTDTASDMAKTDSSPKIPEYRIIGEAFYSYVIIETGDKIMIIDKHAAHERIIFERLKRSARMNLPFSQILLVPIQVRLTPDETAAIEDFTEDFRKMGFAFTADGTGVELTAIPSDIETRAAEDMFVAFADQILSGAGNVRIPHETLFDRALYQMSCKAAIKAGHDEDISHIKWIVENMLSLDCIKFCPHGRPVAFEMTKKELECKFGRE